MKLDLRKTLKTAQEVLEKNNISYALIGGFALGAHGIHRTTQDIDLLVDGNQKDRVKDLFLKQGFEVFFESKEVIQFQGAGFLDILFANRPLSLEMLNTAKVHPSFQIPVVAPEGIIGLKIQAYKNDSSRRLQDLADIQALLKLPEIDLNKVKKYADLFGAWQEVQELIK